MPAKIPKPIREQVIKQWLQGISRDQIAKDNDVGAGTVSSIIKDSKQEIPDIDLLREVAILLKKEELDLDVFGSSIRLKKKMDEMGINEDQIETLIENVNIHCFKRGLSAEELVNTINKVSALSENIGMPLDQLPDYITQQELELVKLRDETEDAKTKQRQVLQHYNVTMDELQEFRRDKPLIDHIKKLEKKLEEAEEEKNYLAEALASKESEIEILESEIEILRSKPTSSEYESISPE
jgi:transcriptional regulator with XRE-family HTH domain